MARQQQARGLIAQIPRIAVAVSVAAALALVGVGFASADTPGTTISVSPSSGLADFQSVAVSGTGFSSGASTTIYQCKGPATAGQCAVIGSLLTDPSGDFSTTVTVSRTGSWGDCGPEDNCIIFAEDSQVKSDSQAISFASVAPTTTTTTTVVTNPQLTANPNTGLADTDTVTASGTGFTPQATVTLSQCKVVNNTFQSCAPIGSSFTDANGDFSTTVPVSRTFNATQGAVQGPVDCGPEDSCVIDATDTGGAQDQAAISFASVTPPANPQITVNPTVINGPSDTVAVSGTGFAPSASVVIYECKLNGGGTQSCAVVGSVLSDNTGSFGPTDVTASETFTATQGVTGTTSCLPENDCVIYAIDSVNNDDAEAITFVELPTTTTTVLPTTTTTAPTTTTTVPRQSATCNALLSARATFNATIDALEATMPALRPVLEAARTAGNAAFSVALSLNNCRSEVFNSAGAASDARVMRSVLPRWVQTTLRNAQSTTPAAMTTSANPGARTYTVQAGDTLSRIAQRLLGSASNYRLLIEANPWLASNPNLIRPGQVLTIPG